MRAVYVPDELVAEVERVLGRHGLILRDELKGAHTRQVVRPVPAFIRKVPVMPVHRPSSAVS